MSRDRILFYFFNKLNSRDYNQTYNIKQNKEYPFSYITQQLLIHCLKNKCSNVQKGLLKSSYLQESISNNLATKAHK